MEAQLAQAKENLARLTDEVELAVHTAYNKLERNAADARCREEIVGSAQRVEPRAAAETLARGQR